MPSNDDFINACEGFEDKHAEVKCIIVDAIKDETVRPLMAKAHILKDNTPCIMIHQGGKAKWFYGPGAITMATELVESSIHDN